MKCAVCQKPFKQDDKVIGVYRYIENERRGDWVTSQPNSYIHLRHLEHK